MWTFASTLTWIPAFAGMTGVDIRVHKMSRPERA